MSYQIHTRRQQLELAIGQGLDILAAVYCDMVRDYGTTDDTFRREVLERFDSLRVIGEARAQ
ncbi:MULTISPECIES: hypothetical protein [Gammaproteobacteria]|uniref:hypothetical protein n=1 Tax=Gammaproteobacteria TaxID=1236 RepID=UPI0037B40185